MRVIRNPIFICGALVVLTVAHVMQTELGAGGSPTTVESLYPGLASGVLAYAMLHDLPSGILLKAGNVEIATDEFNGEVVGAPESMREQLRKNGFFLLEQLATRKLLVQVAKEHADRTGAGFPQNSEKDIIRAYFQQIVEKVEVTESELQELYRENKGMLGGAKLDQVRKQLHQYILHQKREQALFEHIRTLGQRVPILLAASWVREQAILARDNPVDNARMSGRPSLVDFGASGCRPCDMMAPILNDIKKKYEGKLNVVFVHVRKEQILATRYGIQGIPVQIFFDKEGREVFRHTGFFSRKGIENKLKEMGIR